MTRPSEAEVTEAMVDAGARALHNSLGTIIPWDDVFPSMQVSYRQSARTVLRAALSTPPLPSAEPVAWDAAAFCSVYREIWPTAMPDKTIIDEEYPLWRFANEVLARHGTTPPAAAQDTGRLGSLERIADLLSHIWAYGNFRAETWNEREVEKEMRAIGRWPRTTQDIEADAARAAGGE